MKQLWVVLLLLPIALATNIETSETTITIEKSTAIIQTALKMNPTEDIGNLTLILAQNAEDIKITIDGQKANCLLQGEFARCGNLTKGNHTVNITYETNYPIAIVGENTLIKYTERLQIGRASCRERV